jgi:hypothetical protein
MTYPGLVDVESLLKWAGAASTELGFTLVRQIIAAKSATADLDGAYTNSGNLMGFLDAFKAVPRPRTTSAGTKAPSLTRCEDFA